MWNPVLIIVTSRTKNIETKIWVPNTDCYVTLLDILCSVEYPVGVKIKVHNVF